MRTIASLLMALMFTAICQAQQPKAGLVNDGQLPERRLPPATFTDVSIRPASGSESPEGATTYYGRYVVSRTPPTNMFAMAGDPALVELACQDYSVDQTRRSVAATQLIAIRTGNLAAKGDRAEVVGDRLVVFAPKAEDAILYRISSNQFGGAIEELRGKKIVVDLKTWSASADGGDPKSLDRPTPPKKARPPVLIID